METLRNIVSPLENIRTITRSDSKGDRRIAVDYRQYLQNHEISFKVAPPHLVVGTSEVTINWIIHVSVTTQDFNKLIDKLLQFLPKQNISFAIPENSGIHTYFLDGSYGKDFIGKVVTIFCASDINLDPFVQHLIDITAQLHGPAIPSAYYIGGCVYIQYSGKNENLDSWPLSNFKKPKPEKKLKKLKKFLLVDLLKSDAKGNVYKALDLNNWLAISWCVVKEGKLFQCSDDYGRTIKDRLKWQFELLARLFSQIPVSKPLGFFEIGGNSYLATEFVRGKILYELIAEIQQGKIWFSLEKDDKRKLLKFILQLIKLVNLFHVKGVVHRDINPGNFIMTDDRGIVAIDIELAYDSDRKYPNPPFSFGTPGYISPQQQRFETPDFSDDIYSIGALIIKIMTGLSPGKFENKLSLNYQLEWFIKNNSISSMITACLNNDPKVRPSLQSICHTLKVYDILLLTDNIIKLDEAPDRDNNFLKSTIQNCLNAFLNIMPQTPAGLWLFRGVSNGSLLANEFRGFQNISGFANGLAGVLYVIALCEKFHFNTVLLQGHIQKSSEAIEKAFDENSQYPGLLKGSMGLGVAINQLILSNLVESSLLKHDLIYRCLNNLAFEFNVADGIAGRGIAFLQCESNNRLPSCYDELSNIAYQLLEAQNNDGSWLIKKDKSRSKGIKLYGFLYGIAGIVYFLIEYIARYEDVRITAAIQKGLAFLLRGRKPNNGKLCWTVSSINDNFDPWFEYGFSGIALTFIKAYQVIGDDSYKEAAESALYCHPEFISSNYLTIGNGLAGLGEIYLEAYRIFKNNKWLKRADHIADLFAHSYRQDEDQSIYWLNGHATSPEGGFMEGNSGIIHFLLHYLNPQEISFPFNLN
ncbi:lanthionine synthetase LanC family protein [Mucilaginibacter jinjuensis]|uniref:Protein kinase n=1 Tax=Mucilaginibacter jinjuensis TaxID=1176721 RepID=A0ABY7TB99_9SPHI|nr:lanthionine synthetase LanC family protein [Mucilaginibacter jinjuensis]WCT13464.1 protein kinase [Mucilaginibacter jinjuensis]